MNVLVTGGCGFIGVNFIRYLFEEARYARRVVNVDLPTYAANPESLADLAARVLRTPSTPEESFADDPLRMLRAARFASQLGFTVAPEMIHRDNLIVL